MWKLMGLSQMTSLETWTLILVGVALSLIVGWLLDIVAERVGFGIIGNAVICLLAIIMSVIFFRQYIGEMSVARLPQIMGVATASVLLHLFVMVGVRRVLRL